MLLLLPLLTVSASALEEDWGLNELEEAVPGSAEEYLGDSRPDGDWKHLLENLGRKCRELTASTLRRELRFCLVIFLIALLSAVSELADFSGRGKQSIRLASVLAAASAAVTELDAFTSQALEALQQLSDYSRAMLPVLAGTASFSGAVASASARCAATVLVMDALLSVGTRLVAPAICGYTALSVTASALENRALTSAAKLMKTVCNTALTALAGLFTAWQALISAVTGSGEGAAVRLTKTVLSTSLPVVGRMLSDAASSLSAAAGTVRAAAGVFGLGVVLALCALPFIRMGCRYLAFRMTAVLCRTCSDTAVSDLLEELSGSFAMLLALLGTGALCVFVSVWSLMRMSL